MSGHADGYWTTYQQAKEWGPETLKTALGRAENDLRAAEDELAYRQGRVAALRDSCAERRLDPDR